MQICPLFWERRAGWVGVDNGLAKRAPHSGVASRAVIRALAGASGSAWRVSGDDRVETGIEGLVVFDWRRGGHGLEGRESEVAVVEAHAQGLEKVEKRDFDARSATPGRPS